MRSILSASLFAICLVATAACGGGSKKSDTTPPPGPDPAPVTEPTTDPVPVANAGGKLTEAQCKEIFEHAIPIMLEGASPEDKEQFEQNKDQIMEMAVGQCVEQGTQATYECFMKAATQDEIQKCGS